MSYSKDREFPVTLKLREDSSTTYVRAHYSKHGDCVALPYLLITTLGARRTPTQDNQSPYTVVAKAATVLDREAGRRMQDSIVTEWYAYCAMEKVPRRDMRDSVVQEKEPIVFSREGDASIEAGGYGDNKSKRGEFEYDSPLLKRIRTNE